MSDRCTGHCCRRLTIPFSPTQLVGHRDFELKYKAWESEAQLEKERTGELSQDICDRQPKGIRKNDILQIADMLEYIGYFPPGETFTSGLGGESGNMAHYYRCKNLRPNGDCGIYATRPRMCSDYPYGQRCEYAACTWEMVKKDNPPPAEEYKNDGKHSALKLQA